MSEYVIDDAEALAEALARQSWHRKRATDLAADLLISGVIRPAADVRAEALEQAADDLAARLDTFPQQGRHTRARWAEQMLRNWAAAMGGAQ